jgi:hypothetical protein
MAQKTVKQLAEEWVRKNSLTAYVTGLPVGEVNAFIAGFEVAENMMADAWDDGFEQGKLAALQGRVAGDA